MQQSAQTPSLSHPLVNGLGMGVPIRNTEKVLDKTKAGKVETIVVVIL